MKRAILPAPTTVSPPMVPIGHITPGTPRAEAWLRVFGRLAVPLTSAKPVEADSPEGPQLFYFIDRWRIVRSFEEEDALVQRLAAEWKISVDETWREIFDNGLPVPARGLRVCMEPIADWPRP